MERLTNPRALRGLAILSKGDMIQKVSKGTWVVKSQTGTGEYTVIGRWGRMSWTCECPDYKERQTDCKHILAVKFSLKLRQEVEHDAQTESTLKDGSLVCPRCGGTKIVARGQRTTKRGPVQMYGCTACQYRFTPDRGFSRMQHDPKNIMSALDLYFKGMSLRKICDHLAQFYGKRPDPTTPMRWIRRYLKLLGEYAEQYKAEVGAIWHSDEMTVFLKKKGEVKYYEWIWNVMDAETRFLLACKITKTRYVEDARKPLKAARIAADRRPALLVTDGLQGYNDAVKAEFYDSLADIRNPHFRLKSFEIHPNNNILERLNGTIRERMKVMRSFSTLNGADAFSDGMRTYYNYLRPHMGLNGLTPAEAAHIPVDLSGNRWETMIELATVQNREKSRNATAVSGEA